MADYKVKVLDVKPVTHNVHAFTIEKPAGFTYIPGQATDLSILKENWASEKRPFTFTSLQESDFLQFTIKSYADRNGVTNQLLSVEPGDYFEISDAWVLSNTKEKAFFWLAELVLHHLLPSFAVYILKIRLAIINSSFQIKPLLILF